MDIAVNLPSDCDMHGPRLLRRVKLGARDQRVISVDFVSHAGKLLCAGFRSCLTRWASSDGFEDFASRY
jgi:hypothetical protein